MPQDPGEPQYYTQRKAAQYLLHRRIYPCAGDM
uniref:Uncharacterized protein n=1 Tax=Anguilla anguilla TaxID=7936 RepID=A0A0E9S4I8_ANGAN